jgi:hypothetical protein
MFTVQSIEQSGLLTLSTEALCKMKYEFGDYADELFEDGLQRLIITTKEKMKAVIHLEEMKSGSTSSKNKTPSPSKENSKATATETPWFMPNP